ncbi:MAG TPA: 1-acyl-sn-glycerol-3-phosphate acyltransferase [Candidatus Binatia bacterium]|nr:1-acyl-sn-glycerol-3-phosphate acyltransferase [Candidatus Binatia bacterium]
MRPRAARRKVSGAAIDPEAWPTRAFLALADVLGRYHRHRVVHLDRLGRLLRSGRRVILVGNHALDIVDPLLLLATVFRKLHRVPRFIGHENGWFRVPVLRDISERFQVIPSRRPEEAVAALRRDGFLMLYPGAIREAGMRSYRDEPYRLKWEGRTGAIRLALDADAEIVFVAALGADEAYYQSIVPTPEALIGLINAGDGERYRGMRLSFGLLGLHLVPGVLPLPVRLTHVIAEPLDLGDRERARRDPDALAALHERVWGECQHFLDRVVAGRARYSDRVDRSIRAAEQLLQGLGL